MKALRERREIPTKLIALSAVASHKKVFFFECTKISYGKHKATITGENASTGKNKIFSIFTAKQLRCSDSVVHQGG